MVIRSRAGLVPSLFRGNLGQYTYHWAFMLLVVLFQFGQQTLLKPASQKCCILLFFLLLLNLSFSIRFLKLSAIKMSAVVVVVVVVVAMTAVTMAVRQTFVVIFVVQLFFTVMMAAFAFVIVFKVYVRVAFNPQLFHLLGV